MVIKCVKRQFIETGISLVVEDRVLTPGLIWCLYGTTCKASYLCDDETPYLFRNIKNSVERVYEAFYDIEISSIYDIHIVTNSRYGVIREEANS